MSLTLELPPKLEAALRALARQAGHDPDSYIVHTLEEHVQRQANLSPRLPVHEADLLLEINRGLPPALWQRYHELVGKRRAETLTPVEQEELIALSDQIEIWNARRLELLLELSRQRGVPFQELAKEMGLTAPSEA